MSYFKWASHNQQKWANSGQQSNCTVTGRHFPNTNWLTHTLALRSCPTGPAGRGWSSISTSGCCGRLYSRQRSQMSFFNCCRSWREKSTMMKGHRLTLDKLFKFANATYDRCLLAEMSVCVCVCVCVYSVWMGRIFFSFKSHVHGSKWSDPWLCQVEDKEWLPL